MTSLPSRRAGVMMLDWELSGALRFRWLQEYGNDPEFRGELSELLDTHSDTIRSLVSVREWWRVRRIGEQQSEAVGKYVSDVEGLAGDDGYKLDLVTDGPDLLHTWLTRHIERPDLTPLDMFPAGAFGAGGMKPDVGETVSRDVYLFTDPGGESVRIVDEQLVPRIHIQIDDSWQADQESRADAKKRFKALAVAVIDAELDRIEREHRDAGYTGHDTRNQIGAHMRMTYRRYIYKESPSDIAASDPSELSADAVGKAVRSLASELGLPPYF